MEPVKLSASSLASVDSCSWIYYAQYVLKIPQSGNVGSYRGTICHLIFNLLAKEKHEKTRQAILKAGDPFSCKAIKRLVVQHMKKVGIGTKENYELMREMILVGFQTVAEYDKVKMLGNEMKFEIKENGYYLKGFIDRLYQLKDSILVVDFKSSKAKFPKSALATNIQAMMYSLAARTLYKAKTSVEFIFLRFPKKPTQEIAFSDKTLDGFVEYLKYMASYLRDFTMDKALVNLAAEKYEKRWMCGSLKAGAWVCPYRKPFKYYGLMNKEGEITKTSLNKLTNKDGLACVELTYSGCPHHINKNNEEFIS